MKTITQVFKDIMTPDDQPLSWYGWATNQMAHAFLGSLVAVFAGAYWLAITVGLAVTKEGFDLYRSFNRQSIVDSMTDTLFWVTGAGVIGGGEYRLCFAIVFFALLTAGVYCRVKRNKYG